MTLDEVARDTKRDNPGLTSRHPPACGHARYCRTADRIADMDKSRTAVRDAALRALARLDAAQGVPTLLEALNDDRGRIAIYALRGALLQMPPAAALQCRCRPAPLRHR